MTNNGKGLSRFPTPTQLGPEGVQGGRRAQGQPEGAVAFVRGTQPTLQGESSPDAPKPSGSLRQGGRVGEEQVGE